MRKHAKRISIQTLGFLCLLLGIAGVILPVLNGVVFLAAGLILLSLYSPWAKRLLVRIGSTHPKAEKVIGRVENFVLKHVGDIEV